MALVPPLWTLLPFGSLVLGIAILPWLLPHFWERHSFQALLSAACALPVVAFVFTSGDSSALTHALSSYLTFILTLGALYVAAGGVVANVSLAATPLANVALVLIGCLLASIIGTTGASVLMIRPLLHVNQRREHRSHLVPLFILAVSNAGGMLTPLGDPPLLLGFIAGVPFFWTLRLWPIWLLYNSIFLAVLYALERRACQREAPPSLVRLQAGPTIALEGRRNLGLLLAIAAATFLSSPVREITLLALALASYAITPRAVRAQNGFSFAPLLEVALVFVGLFVCLLPVELTLSGSATELPVQHAYQLFWASGMLSAALDNAPTYAAFTALARTLSEGQAGLIAGVAPLKLMAISAGCVVMGATTYIGNGPNLMVKAMAERAGFVMPSFLRYAVFALLVMLPAHLLLTLALVALE